MFRASLKKATSKNTRVPLLFHELTSSEFSFTLLVFWFLLYYYIIRSRPPPQKLAASYCTLAALPHRTERELTIPWLLWWCRMDRPVASDAVRGHGIIAVTAKGGMLLLLLLLLVVLLLLLVVRLAVVVGCDTIASVRVVVVNH